MKGNHKHTEYSPAHVRWVCAKTVPSGGLNNGRLCREPLNRTNIVNSTEISVSEAQLTAVVNEYIFQEINNLDWDSFEGTAFL